MNEQKLTKIVMLIALFICVFIIVDCYFIPQKERTEIVQQKNKYKAQSPGKRSNSINNEIITNKSKHDVSDTLYNGIAEKDTVQIFYSTVSHSIQKIKIKKAETVLVFQNNYLDVNHYGWLYLFMLAFLSLLLQSDYKDLIDKNARRGFTLLTFTFSFILSYFYVST